MTWAVSSKMKIIIFLYFWFTNVVIRNGLRWKLCLKYGNWADIATKLVEVKMATQKQSIKNRQTMNKKFTRLKVSFNFKLWLLSWPNSPNDVLLGIKFLFETIFSKYGLILLTNPSQLLISGKLKTYWQVQWVLFKLTKYFCKLIDFWQSPTRWTH